MADYKKKPEWNYMDSTEYRVLVHRLDSATSREERVAILKQIAALRTNPFEEPPVNQVFAEKHEPAAPSEILEEKPAKKGIWQKLKDMFKV